MDNFLNWRSEISKPFSELRTRAVKYKAEFSFIFGKEEAFKEKLGVTPATGRELKLGQSPFVAVAQARLTEASSVGWWLLRDPQASEGVRQA